MWSAKNLLTRGNRGKRRSTQESSNVTLCRSTNRTTSHSSPQRLTKICRNRHAKHAPRPRRPKLREVESRSTCGCFAYSGMSIVFQIDEVANEISARSGQQSTKSDVEFCVPPTGFALELSPNVLITLFRSRDFIEFQREVDSTENLLTSSLHDIRRLV
jgi:hypothetical protein